MSYIQNPKHSKLNVVIKTTKPVLVRFFRDRCVMLGFLCLEACLLPQLPGNYRVIGGCESFLFADGGDPSVNRLLVSML